MADLKISQLSDGGNLQANDEIPIVRGGNNYRATPPSGIEFLADVNADIQGQLDGKQPLIDGAASTITTSDLEADRAVITTATGKITESDVTAEELGFLAGAESNIQDQINAISGGGSPDNVTIEMDSAGELSVKDNGISLAKMEHGTRGDILYYGNGGAPSRLGAGTSGQGMYSGGAGADPSWGESVKVILATKNTADADGTQSITGAGFTPKSVRIDGTINGTAASCFGVMDGTTQRVKYSNSGGTAGSWNTATAVAFASVSSGNTIIGVGTLTADGVDIAWTKTGAPTGSLNMVIQFMR